MSKSILTLYPLVAALSFAQVPNAGAESDVARNLQQQQLQDALELNLIQSSPRSRAELSPADALRLQQLQLRQRMDQQQLEQHQLQRERVHRNRDDRTAALERRLLAQERQLQLQRFDLEQRTLLRGMRPQPLERRQPSGQRLP